jgi:hypothetical protein
VRLRSGPFEYLCDDCNPAFPIAWHDVMKPFPKPVTVASCFAIKFRERLIGVTAAHVLNAYREAQRANPNVKSQLLTLPFNLEKTVIDHDDELDLATFALSELQLPKLYAFGCEKIWPPPEPIPQSRVCFAGYPGFLIASNAEGGMLPDSAPYCAVPLIQDVTEREIILTYDPVTARADPNIPPPPLGANLSGCSGAPLILPVTIDEVRVHAFPVGVTVFGADKDRDQEHSRGEMAAFDTIRARRIHCIRPDGTIERPGWLPPKKHSSLIA